MGVYKIAAPIAPARTPRVIKPVGLPPNALVALLVIIAGDWAIPADAIGCSDIILR